MSRADRYVGLSAAVLGELKGARELYNVLPATGDEEVLWVDPAGYELARSVGQLGLYDTSDVAHDYVLETKGRATVRRLFARSRRP